MRAVLTSVEQGSYVSRSGVTLADYLQEWLTTVRPRLRKTTCYSDSVAVTRARLSRLTAYCRASQLGKQGTHEPWP
jgi:hypothetical protein